MKYSFLRKFIVVLGLLFFLNSCNYYNYIFKKNVKETTHIYIPKNTDYQTVIKIIEPYLYDIESFKWVAEKKKYPKLIKSGRYLIEEGENNNSLINKLRIGSQDPVELKLGYEIQTMNQLAEILSKNLDFSKADFLASLAKKDFIVKSQLNSNEQLIFFLPDTYEVYWNTTPDEFLDKMKNEYDKFWTQENREKAKNLGLTVLEINTLASIVQYESDKKDEQPRIAGLYLNRLKKGIKLQADPTIKYALRQKNDFKIDVKRIYNKDLSFDSPYNTYKNVGLPPAPLGLATKNAINATLNATKHNYIFMCANPEKPGYHWFEESYLAHEKNAQRYREWANKNGVN